MTSSLSLAPLSEAACRSIVTVGGVASHVTVSSIEVEAALPLPAVSEALSASIEAMTVPFVVMPLTAMS